MSHSTKIKFEIQEGFDFIIGSQTTIIMILNTSVLEGKDIYWHWAEGSKQDVFMIMITLEVTIGHCWSLWRWQPQQHNRNVTRLDQDLDQINATMDADDGSDFDANNKYKGGHAMATKRQSTRCNHVSCRYNSAHNYSGWIGVPHSNTTKGENNNLWHDCFFYIQGE